MSIRITKGENGQVLVTFPYNQDEYTISLT